MGRAPCCEKIGLKKGRWTAEEDSILRKYIQAHGEGSWRSLPKNAGLLRCGKSCRLRWVNYLKSDLKRGKFSSDEDETIIKLHASLGNRWCLIASHLPGRTDNEIKNYWNSHLSRQIYNFRKIIRQVQQQSTAVTVDHQPKPKITNSKRKGKTSRSAMKKNKSYIASRLHNPPPPPPKCIENGENVFMPATPSLEEASMVQDTNENMDILFGSLDDLEVCPKANIQSFGDQDNDIENWLIDTNMVESKGTEDAKDNNQLMSLISGGENCNQFGSYPNQELDILDWDWSNLEMDSGVQGKDNELWDMEEDKVLCGLWENSGDHRVGDDGDCSTNKLSATTRDTEKQNAMVEWLLS